MEPNFTIIVTLFVSLMFVIKITSVSWFVQRKSFLNQLPQKQQLLCEMYYLKGRQ